VINHLSAIGINGSDKPLARQPREKLWSGFSTDDNPLSSTIKPLHSGFIRANPAADPTRSGANQPLNRLAVLSGAHRRIEVNDRNLSHQGELL
jgi:hypothetical protein